MREMKINDATTENASIREDGRVMRDYYVFQVKTPAESKGPWDFLKQIGTVKAQDAAMPLSKKHLQTRSEVIGPAISPVTAKPAPRRLLLSSHALRKPKLKTAAVRPTAT